MPLKKRCRGDRRSPEPNAAVRNPTSFRSILDMLRLVQCAKAICFLLPFCFCCLRFPPPQRIKIFASAWPRPRDATTSAAGVLSATGWSRMSFLVRPIIWERAPILTFWWAKVVSSTMNLRRTNSSAGPMDATTGAVGERLKKAQRRYAAINSAGGKVTVAYEPGLLRYCRAAPGPADHVRTRTERHPESPRSGF